MNIEFNGVAEIPAGQQLLSFPGKRSQIFHLNAMQRIRQTNLAVNPDNNWFT